MKLSGFGSRLLLVFSLLSAVGAHPSQAQERISLPPADLDLDFKVEELFTVGSMDGADWQTFSRVSSVAFDSQGNLLILDSGNQRVIKVGPTGQLLAEIGRGGEGPGEFGFPHSFAVLPDNSLAVFDIPKRGFALFHPDGTFDRTVPLLNGFEGMPGGKIQALPSGGLVAEGMVLTRMSSGGVQTFGDDSARPIFRYSLEDGASETLFRGWRPEAPSSPRVSSAAGGGRMVVYAGAGERVFDPDLHFAVLSDGSLAVVDSTTYAVKVVGEDGRVVRILERPVEPREVTRADEERERDRRLEEAESGGGSSVAVSSGGGARVIRGDAAVDMAKEQIQNLEFAEEIPVVQRLSVDERGRIWLERTGSEVGTDGPIDLFTPGGEYLGTLGQGMLRFPDAFGPGGRVAFIEKGEYDVPRVKVKRLTLG